MEHNSGEFKRKRTLFILFLAFLCGGDGAAGLELLFKEGTSSDMLSTGVSLPSYTLDRDSIMNQTGPDCTVEDVPEALVYAMVNLTPSEGL